MGRALVLPCERGRPPALSLPQPKRGGPLPRKGDSRRRFSSKMLLGDSTQSRPSPAAMGGNGCSASPAEKQLVSVHPPQLQGEQDHPGAPTFCQAFQRAQPPAAPIVSVGMMGPFPLSVQAPCRLWQAVLHKVSLTPSRLEPCHCPCQWRWWCINMRLASCIIICRAGARLALHTRGEP